MMLHQSAHIRVTEASVSADDFPSQSSVLLLVMIIYFLNVYVSGDIKWASHHMNGVADPSNVDACCWRHMCTLRS